MRFAPKDYDTRLDRFRRKEGIPILDWAEEAGISRSQLGKYRAGIQQPSSPVLAELVRAARRLTGRPVKASDLYDLGEDEPLNTASQEGRTRRTSVRKHFDTRFDRCLLREGVSPGRLAQKAGTSRQGLRWKRAGVEYPSVRLIARLVRAMRQMGRDVTASDMFDVGEDL